MQWVWLRGLGRHSAHWGDLPTVAQKQGLGPILLLDLPGFGGKSHLQSPTRIDGMITELQGALIGRAKPHQPLALMGLSLGGWVAMQWAARDARIQQLVMINSSSNLSPITDRLQPRALLRLSQALWLGRRSMLAQEQKIVGLVSNRRDTSGVLADDWVNQWAVLAEKSPMTLRQLIRQLWLAATTPAPKPEGLSHCQTHIIASDADRLVRAQCSQTLANYLGADLWHHTTAGHDLAMDDPQWLIQCLLTIEKCSNKKHR